MVAILRSMEKISVETIGEVSRLCSLTGNLQRRLDLEYSTPENNRTREMMREASHVMKPVIPLFSLPKENGNKGKNKKGSRVSQLVLEEILEAELPDPLFSLNSRG
ncbi:hypothetical protein COP1_034406 [Malus domestica]